MFDWFDSPTYYAALSSGQTTLFKPHLNPHKLRSLKWWIIVIDLIKLRKFCCTHTSPWLAEFLYDLAVGCRTWLYNSWLRKVLLQDKHLIHNGSYRVKSWYFSVHPPSIVVNTWVSLAKIKINKTLLEKKEGKKFDLIYCVKWPK